MKYFDALGAHVAGLWSRYNNDELSFPEVAHAALLKMPPHENATFEEIVKYALHADTLLFQEDIQAEFGQPPLTIYLGRAFRIEVLFWTGATPAIHQHAFSGAFHVMQGSSIHLAWTFEPEQRVTSHLHFGPIGLKLTELLQVGDIRLIHAGNQFIHTTFHLDKPTISIVVRTTHEQDHMPQYSYLPPSICYNARENMPWLRRKCQILGMLVNAGRPEEHDNMLSELFRTSDAFAVFHYLYQANMLRDKQSFERLLEQAAVHHPALAAKTGPALANIRRQTETTKLRNQVSDPDLRFFLALLINLTDRESILALLKQRYASEDPVAKFAGFVKELSDADLLGEKFTQPWITMLECLLRGMTSRPEIERAFALKYGEAQVQNQRVKLTNLAITISRFWLFKSLLTYQSEPLWSSAAVNAGPERKQMTA